MANLQTNLAGIKSPNPFWLASAPPTNSGYQIMKAFDAGWGGAVWKTLGVPVINVSSRYGSLNYRDTRMMGFNNIELITDRPLRDNLREIEEVKKRFPNHAVIASLMVETKEEWHQIMKDVTNAGADGVELNFGCPHGMCERGMGSAVGQEPKILKMIVEWVKEVATIPVIVKSMDKGITIAVNSAARKFPKKRNKITMTRSAPMVKFSLTVSIVASTRSVRL